MKTFRVLFYKSKVGDGKWIDNAISLWTMFFNWGTKNYSHCEVWLPDENGEFQEPDWDEGKYSFVGQCFTSTMRDKIDGTVIRPASEVLKHHERWDYCEGEAEDADYENAVAWAYAKVAENEGYGKRTIGRFFMPIWLFKLLRLEEENKDICSEVAEMFCIIAKWICEKLFRSPRRLSRKLIKKGYVIKPLVEVE